MSDERKLMYILLIIIAVSSLILMIKIYLTPQYDIEVYNRIYSEYENIEDTNEEISKKEETDNSQDDTSQSDTSPNVIYKYAGVTSNTSYMIDGKITIAKIGISYPVVHETSDEYLKIAPTKLAGPNMNRVGNYCIAGHNYNNDQFFSKVPLLEIGDMVALTSTDGKSLTYKVYSKYELNETDLSCLEQNTDGKIELTLITCTKIKKNRLIVKCRAVS